MNVLRWRWPFVVLLCVAWWLCAAVATFRPIYYSASGDFYAPFYDKTRLSPAQLGIIWGPPVLLLVARAVFGRGAPKPADDKR